MIVVYHSMKLDIQDKAKKITELMAHKSNQMTEVNKL